MLDPASVPEVTQDELLARFIYQSSHIRPSNGTVKPNAFLPPANLLCSVTRHLEASEAELWSVGQHLAQQREATLHARADFQTEVCVRQGLRVLKAPVQGNPNHANMSGWPADKAAQKIIAQELAAAASLVVPPEALPDPVPMA
jgi:hypothetical protein